MPPKTTLSSAVDLVKLAFPGASSVNHGAFAGPLAFLSLKKNGHNVANSEIPARHTVRIAKCGCGSTWCPSCFRRKSLKVAIKKLGDFNPNKTRHVVLTCSRSQFSSGEEAYRYVSENKLIPGLVRNLKRTKKRAVVNWIWFLEWHQDGFPHWHLFIEMGDSGRGAMIGGDTLRGYWRVGDWVVETFIKGSAHWKALLGYFSKNGYFEKKEGYQAQLPGWALQSNRKIRRWGCMAGPINGSSAVKDDDMKSNMAVNSFRRESRIYEVILKSCGLSSFVEVSCEDYGIGRRVQVESKVLKKLLVGGSWIEGKGFCALLNLKELIDFLRSDVALLSLRDLVQEMETKSPNGCWIIY